jgi:hypothetical protein
MICCCVLVTMQRKICYSVTALNKLMLASIRGCLHCALLCCSLQASPVAIGAATQLCDLVAQALALCHGAYPTPSNRSPRRLHLVHVLSAVVILSLRRSARAGPSSRCHCMSCADGFIRQVTSSSAFTGLRVLCDALICLNFIPCPSTQKRF